MQGKNRDWEVNIYMQRISELLFNESNFQVKLRNDNYFDSKEFEKIRIHFKKHKYMEEKRYCTN